MLTKNTAFTNEDLYIENLKIIGCMVNEHIVVYNMATDDICEGRFDEGESLLLLC
jgi:hypothetical protein